MVDYSGAIMRPPRGKLANYITMELPAATVATTGAEETEIETGISLPELQGIRWLGVEFSELSNLIVNAAIAAAADLNVHLDVVFASRTGDFNLDDPEYIEGYQFGMAVLFTEGGLAGYMSKNTVPEGGDVIVTPRIFVRFGNDIGGNVTANTFQLRAGYEFERIVRNKFIELLERFADIFVI